MGGKAGLVSEHSIAVAAARALNRPVKWSETRSENLVGMPHGRGQVQWIEMGFDDDARLTGMRCRVLADSGAYAGFGGALAIGLIFGVLFLAAGAGRLYVESRR